MPPVHTTLPTTHASLKTQVLNKDADAQYSKPYASKDNFNTGPNDHSHGEAY
jgi:endo-1,4-beta-mannosidase